MAFLEMWNITKRYPSVVANSGINFSVERGEIHALLGENGAGKSTLMNILYGLSKPTSGEIRIQGKPVSISSPKAAMALGIGMVHQHFMLIPALTVVENLVLGRKENHAILNLEQAAEELRLLAERYGMDVDPHAKVWQLSVGQQQRVEILKALYRGADLLILDEPTAVLTPREVEELFTTLRQLTKEGHTVIFITHKLGEVMEICDRCTVLRQGHLAAALSISEIQDKKELAGLMVGREVELSITKAEAKPGDMVLKVTGLEAKNGKGLPALRGVSFSVRAGEILGVAGVDGNGQSELVECLTGLRCVEQGEILVGGIALTNASPRKILEQGVAHIPEDRHKRGMAADLSVKENLIMMGYYHPPYSRRGFLNWKWITAHTEQLCQTYHVKTPSLRELAGKLSGGNQQKFVVGRELERNPRLLIAMHPDRGLDIGATKYIQSRILEQRDRGCAVLLVSTELDEILELSDRILVLFDGQVMGIVDAAGVTREELGLMMAGAHRQCT